MRVLARSVVLLAALMAVPVVVPSVAASLGLVAHAGTALSLTAADGSAIKATSYGKGTNGVVLVHDKGRSSADWGPFAEKLASQGFHVVAVDLRGHGASKPPDTLGEADWPKTPQDVAAAVAHLKGKGATKIALLGAGFGANAALAAAADDVGVTNLVLLSPGLNINGVTVGAAMEKYGARPVLLVASAEDAYAARSVNYLDGKAAGAKHLEILSDAGSGAKMLNRDAGLENTLLSWLNGSFFLKAGAKAPEPQLNTGADAGALETTGTKFGEKKE